FRQRKLHGGGHVQLHEPERRVFPRRRRRWAVDRIPLAVDHETLERAEQASRAVRGSGEANEAVRQRLSETAPLELLLRDRLPALLDELKRLAGDRSSRQLEMLGPQPLPRLAGDGLVAGDEVQLGVVEERVLVQVRRAD